MIAYTVDATLRVVFIRHWGRLTELEMNELADAIRADPRVSPDWPKLVDARDVTEYRVGAPFLRGYRSAFSPAARRAVIVSSTFVRGMTNLYGLSQGLDDVLRVCTTEAEALEWLALPAETVIPVVGGLAAREKAAGGRERA